MKRIILSTSLIVIMVAIFTLGGCRKKHSPEEKANYMVEKISSKLDLTDTQETELEKIKVEVLAKFKEQRETRKKTHSEVITALRNNQVNEKFLKNMAARREATHKKLKPFVIEKILEFNKILTQDQRNKLADLLEKKFNRHFE